MKLTVCLEGNAEGRVLASVDMEEIVKMTITDDIEKSNFNPQMLKSCTDTSYQCGYEQGRAAAIDEFLKELYPCRYEYNDDCFLCGSLAHCMVFIAEGIADKMKEAKSETTN